MEASLLSQQTLHRLSDCASEPEIFKILTENGFGAGAQDGKSVDALLKKEEHNNAALLKQLNSEGGFEAFLIRYDYNNVKAFLKAKVSGNEKPELMPEGLYDTSRLKTAAQTGDVFGLPEQMAHAVKCTGKSLAECNCTSHSLDTEIDKAYFADAASRVKKSHKLIKKYFLQKADFVNILSFFRCVRLGLGQSFFTQGFVGGGSLGAEFFAELPSFSASALAGACAQTEYKELVDKAAKSGNLIEFEKETDIMLLNMWRAESADMFSPAPVLAFYFGKLAEIKTVKLITAGVKNNVAPALIKERIRLSYA
jgi:V/A-type H+-transporting ATPase subunit C